MNKKKPIIDKGMIIAVTLFVIFVVVCGYVFSELTFSVYERYDINYLQGELDKKENITDSYRQGWQDCIESLEDLRCKVENITSQMDNAGMV